MSQIRRPRSNAFSTALRKLFSVHRRNTRTPRRLQLECLEDRLVPAVIDVTTLSDGTGPGTLRSAIAQANTNDANNDTTNTIDLTVAGTYNIGQSGLGALAIFSNAAATQSGLSLTIENTSDGNVAISGDNSTRVFDINPNDILPTNPNGSLGAVTITGVTIENGVAQSGNGATGGGGIRDQGPVDLTLNNDIVTNNSATADGGGISMENLTSTHWTLTLTNTTVSNNQAEDAGGGVEEDGTGQVNIINSTIADNGCVNQGGGVWLDAINGGTATLNVTNSTVSGNTAGLLGGGIGNAGTSTVTITTSTVAHNFTAGNGGGFANASTLGNTPAGTLIVQNSLFLDNSAVAVAGGIEEGNVLTITNSEIKGNVAGDNGGMPKVTTGGGQIPGIGGGLLVYGGTLTLTDSTIADNRADGGGGIELLGTVNATITNSTIVGNSALLGGGGGILVDPFSDVALTLLNDTITNNFAIGGGGGLVDMNNGLGDNFSFQNTIIAGNTATAGAPDVGGGPTTDLGGNLIGISVNGSSNFGFTANTDQTGTVGNPLNPQFGPLTNNGGPVAGAPGDPMTVETEALLPGSPAIGKGVANGAPATDERGFNRLSPPDLGAFQFQNAALTIAVTPTTPSVTVNGSETFAITVTNSSGNALPADNSPLTVALSPGLTASGPLTFPVGALAAGQSQTFTITATATTLGTQTLTASLTSADANPNTASGSAAVTVVANTPPTSPPPTTHTPVGALTLFGFGFGPSGLDVFEVDSQGDVFAQGFGISGLSGAPLFVASDAVFTNLSLRSGALVADLVSGSGQPFLMEMLNFSDPFVFRALLNALFAGK